MTAMKPISELISLKGKKALITGAASGIGRAAALRFAEAGADLELVDVDEFGLKGVRELAEEFGVEVNVHRVDLSRKVEIDLLWEALRGREPDILVNNAGVYWFKEFIEVDEDFYEKVMAINLHSVFWMCQHFVRARKDAGRDNQCELHRGLPALCEGFGSLRYGQARCGRLNEGDSEGVREEDQGKRCGSWRHRDGRSEETQEEAIMKFDVEKMGISFHFNARLPMGRFGEPDEVARVMLFLSSDLASYVNGAVIPVDGGFLST